ncbi:MAG TPA: alpha/beta fold hydrolase [Pyrinomonadaceae bacterium]|nr:alpha/beta fold hydrolase [Pyrinomonadaceae bacterium]
MSDSARLAPSCRTARLSKLRFALVVAALVLCAVDARAQQQQQNVTVDAPRGYWTGAFVREGSAQIVTAEFISEGNTLRVETLLPDRPFAPPLASPVERDASGALLFRTAYGQARMRLDTTLHEMVGQVGASAPPMSLHLRRTLRPAVPEVRTEEVTFRNGSVTLAGTLVLPGGAGPHPLAIFAQGRGCPTRAGSVGRARVLARYGIAGFAFDKRGAGASTGNCERATFDEEVSDMRAAVEALSARADVDRTQVGIIAHSAGGWVAARVANLVKTPLAFVITSAGPATSVREQQFDNARYISRELGLKPEDEKLFMRYVELMFEEGNPQAQFAEMQRLLEHGKRTGWGAEFLADTDVAPSADEIKNLWVRRFSYDPADDLRKIRVPFLAFYGGSDRVVPPRENEPLLHRLLTEAGNRHFRVMVIPEAGHNLVQDAQLRKLSSAEGEPTAYYWKFPAFSPDYLIETVEFLHANLKMGDARMRR